MFKSSFDVNFQGRKPPDAERSRTRLSESELALLEEELRSPCSEEVALFIAFSRIVMHARQECVAIDTAPTGHTLLLRDTMDAYHQQLIQQSEALPGRVTTPLMRLRDPDYSKILLVTTPETTPVLEAESLQQNLRRAEVEPFAWVINASLLAARPRDSTLVARVRRT